MNMTLFKILKYLMKYKEINILDPVTFTNVFGFLSMLSLNSIATPALNNLKKEANKTICMLCNKCSQTIPEFEEMIEKIISDALDFIKNKTEDLESIEDSTIAQAFGIIKGLAIKGSPKSFQIIKSIIEQLKTASDPVLRTIVKYWPVLFSAHDFNKKNKFNIFPFYNFSILFFV